MPWPTACSGEVTRPTRRRRRDQGDDTVFADGHHVGRSDPRAELAAPRAGGRAPRPPSTIRPDRRPGQAGPRSGPTADDRPWSSSTFWILQLVVLALYLIRLASSWNSTSASPRWSSSSPPWRSSSSPWSTPPSTTGSGEPSSPPAGSRSRPAALRLVSRRPPVRRHLVRADTTRAARWPGPPHRTARVGRTARPPAGRGGQPRPTSVPKPSTGTCSTPTRPRSSSSTANGIVVEANASAQRAFGGLLPSDIGVGVRVGPGVGRGRTSTVRLDAVRPVAHPTGGHDRTRRRGPCPHPTRLGTPCRRGPVGRGTATSRPGGAGGVRGRRAPGPVPSDRHHAGSADGDRRMQVIFEDVTAETRRHDRMEAYASQVVLGQEEERRHIAQEIHDGPLQTLIHLCRQIDAVESQPRRRRHGDAQRSASDLRDHSSRTRWPSCGPSPGACGRRSSTTWVWWPPSTRCCPRPASGSGSRASFGVDRIGTATAAAGRARPVPHRPGGADQRRASRRRPAGGRRARVRRGRAPSAGQDDGVGIRRLGDSGVTGTSRWGCRA